MSSKEKASSGEAPGPRQPKCARCRHHGLVVPQKGHGKRCPFHQCRCWKCLLITERTRINAQQRVLHRGTEERPPADRAAAGQGHQARTGTSPEKGARPPVPGPVYPAPRAPGPYARATAEGARPPETADRASKNNYSSFWGHYGPPVSFLHLPGPMPPSHLHFSNFLVNMPWAPVPPGLYEGNLMPLMVPHFLPGPPPPPPVEPRPVFMTFRHPAPKQEALSRLPRPQHPEEDTEESKVVVD